MLAPTAPFRRHPRSGAWRGALGVLLVGARARPPFVCVLGGWSARQDLVPHRGCGLPRRRRPWRLVHASTCVFQAAACARRRPGTGPLTLGDCGRPGRDHAAGRRSARVGPRHRPVARRDRQPARLLPRLDPYVLSRNTGTHVLHSLLVQASVDAFGFQDWAVRLPALLAGIVTVPVFLGGAARLHLDAVSRGRLPPRGRVPHVFFSQNARGYTALLLFGLASTGLLTQALRRDRSSAPGRCTS